MQDLRANTPSAAGNEACRRRRLPVAGRPMRISLAVIPGLFGAALPKCPLCLLAYAGALNALGFSPSSYRTWIAPITFVLLSAALAMLLVRASRRRGLGPFVLGLIAVVVITEGKFDHDDASLVYLGMSLLLAASIWNSWPKRKKSLQPDCDCHS